MVFLSFGNLALAIISLPMEQHKHIIHQNAQNFALVEKSTKLAFQIAQNFQKKTSCFLRFFQTIVKKSFPLMYHTWFCSEHCRSYGRSYFWKMSNTIAIIDKTMGVYEGIFSFWRPLKNEGKWGLLLEILCPQWEILSDTTSVLIPPHSS